jgi:hypothetical protein
MRSSSGSSYSPRLPATILQRIFSLVFVFPRDREAYLLAGTSDVPAMTIG